MDIPHKEIYAQNETPKGGLNHQLKELSQNIELGSDEQIKENLEKGASILLGREGQDGDDMHKDFRKWQLRNEISFIEFVKKNPWFEKNLKDALLAEEFSPTEVKALDIEEVARGVANDLFVSMAIAVVRHNFDSSNKDNLWGFGMSVDDRQKEVYIKNRARNILRKEKPGLDQEATNEIVIARPPKAKAALVRKPEEYKAEGVEDHTELPVEEVPPVAVEPSVEEPVDDGVDPAPIDEGKKVEVKSEHISGFDIEMPANLSVSKSQEDPIMHPGALVFKFTREGVSGELFVSPDGKTEVQNFPGKVFWGDRYIVRVKEKKIIIREVRQE